MHPSFYFDPEESRKEESLFKRRLYAGHEKLLTKPGEWEVLQHTHNRWTLMKEVDEYFLQSNVCLHRQGLISEGRGTKRIQLCRAHCWSYEEGKIKSTPNCEGPIVGKLNRLPLKSWRGLLYEGDPIQFNLSEFNVEDYINFDNYEFHSTEFTDYAFNWKTFSEVYLENLHIYSMHPGLRQFVDPTKLQWNFGEDWSLQRIGLREDISKNTSAAYSRMISLLDEKPEFGAIWIYIYPNIMVEWYPKTLAISTIFPNGPESCKNRVDIFFEKESSEEWKRAFLEVYAETAEEDEDACQILNKGRRALWMNGESYPDFIDRKLEAGVEHFWNWLRTSNHKTK